MTRIFRFAGVITVGALALVAAIAPAQAAVTRSNESCARSLIGSSARPSLRQICGSPQQGSISCKAILRNSALRDCAQPSDPKTRKHREKQMRRTVRFQCLIERTTRSCR